MTTLPSIGEQPESYDVTTTAELDKDLAAEPRLPGKLSAKRSMRDATRPLHSTPPPDVNSLRPRIVR